MKKPILILLLLAPIMVFCQQKKDSLITWFESSNFMETPSYKETVDYCERLVNSSTMINMINIGQSERGEEIPMLIVDKNSYISPKNIRKAGRAIIFIQACVHPGEPDGKDAGFMLIRNIVNRKMNIKILDYVSIIFLPIFNVDGHERWGAYNRINQNGPKEMGWRTTASNYNLNRDYLKADAIEMQHWLEMYNEWEPDFIFDCHTTDGADYQYAITYSLETSGNLDPALSSWLETNYLKTITTKMDSIGYPIFPYVIFKNWHDPRSGLINYASPIKLLNGYAAARNRGCMLIETHMLKSYKTRVFATYELLMRSLKFFARECETLISLNQKADAMLTSNEMMEQPFPLRYAPNGDSTIVQFRGVHYDIEKSSITGGNWFIYDSTRKETFSIPYYKQLKAESIITLPAAYAIPPEIQFIEQILKIHEIEYFKIKENITIEGEVIKFEKVELNPKSTEGKQTVRSQKNTVSAEKVIIPNGSIIVPVSQLRLKLIAHMFEPDSPDSFLQWGYFNIYFEQKEYAESYVMEKMMREMMDKDPQLKADFDLKYNNDSTFRNNQNEIYNWFYSKTPYWDQKLNVYPIIRIPELKSLELLESYRKNSLLK